MLHVLKGDSRSQGLPYCYNKEGMLKLFKVSSGTHLHNSEKTIAFFKWPLLNCIAFVCCCLHDSVIDFRLLLLSSSKTAMAENSTYINAKIGSKMYFTKVGRYTTYVCNNTSIICWLDFSSLFLCSQNFNLK